MSWHQNSINVVSETLDRVALENCSGDTFTCCFLSPADSPFRRLTPSLLSPPPYTIPSSPSRPLLSVLNSVLDSAWARNPNKSYQVGQRPDVTATAAPGINQCDAEGKE